MSRTVDRVVDILFALYKKDGLSLAELTSTLDIPKTSAYDILSALEKRGIIEVSDLDSKQKTYKLGIELIRLGERALRRLNIADSASTELKKLSLLSNETAYLAIEIENGILYIDKAETKKPIAPTSNIGDRNSLYATALGKAILATYSDDEVRIKAAKGQGFSAGGAISTLDEFIEELGVTRGRGYAIDDHDSCEYMLCIAAPIMGSNGAAIAAISVAIINYHKCDIGFIAENVVKSALAISEKHGFEGARLYNGGF